MLLKSRVARAFNHMTAVWKSSATVHSLHRHPILPRIFYRQSFPLTLTWAMKITQDMIRKVLVRKSSLEMKAQGLMKCPKHALPSRECSRPCHITRKNISIIAHILDPHGIIEVKNPRLHCLNLDSLPFFAMGGTSGAIMNKSTRILPTVSVPAWNGEIVKKKVYAVNETSGVTKHFMTWCNNMGKAVPACWNQGMSNLPTLCLHFDYTLTTICLHFDYILTLTTLWLHRELDEIGVLQLRWNGE